MPLFNIVPVTGSQFIQLLDIRTNGTLGSSAAPGWNDRVINTIKHDDTGLVELNSNHFKLPLGTYYISAIASFYRSFETRIRLFDNTNSQTILLGMNSYVGNIDCGMNALLEGIFNADSLCQFSVQYSVGNTSPPLGVTTNLGVDEIYLLANLWKLS